MWTLEERFDLCEKKVGRFWSGLRSRELQVPARRPVSQEQRRELEEEAKGHIFLKFQGPGWGSLVEQREAAESFKEKRNTRWPMLSKAPLAAKQGKKGRGRRNSRVSSHETFVSGQVFWGSKCQEGLLLQDLEANNCAPRTGEQKQQRAQTAVKSLTCERERGDETAVSP